jgi:inhibitor of cysteine peptidase
VKFRTLIFLLVAAYASGSPEDATVFTFSDKNKTAEVKVGQRIIVYLAGNITTGYSWVRKDTRNDVIKPDGPIEYKNDIHTPHLAGSGGFFVAKYQAVRTGETIMILEYRRPWEKDKEPTEDQIFRMTFVVKQ